MPFRFCLHRHLKRHDEQHSHRTTSAEPIDFTFPVSKYPELEYCPLDLYSGDPQRVGSSVRALLADPRNNLRMFLRHADSLDTVDAALVSRKASRTALYACPMHDPGAMRSTVLKWLGKGDLVSAEASAAADRVLQDALTAVLLDTPCTSLLSRLRFVQQYLDPMDIEGRCGNYALIRNRNQQTALVHGTRHFPQICTAAKS